MKQEPMDAVERAFWDAWDAVTLERERITVIHHGPVMREKARAGLAAAFAVARIGQPFDSRGSLTGGNDGNPAPLGYPAVAELYDG